jgi:hypothetical protein
MLCAFGLPWEKRHTWTGASFLRPGSGLSQPAQVPTGGQWRAATESIVAGVIGVGGCLTKLFVKRPDVEIAYVSDADGWVYCAR